MLLHWGQLFRITLAFPKMCHFVNKPYIEKIPSEKLHIFNDLKLHQTRLKSVKGIVIYWNAKYVSKNQFTTDRY